MNRDEFLEILAEVQKERDKANEEYKAKVAPLDEKERLVTEQYIEANANFKMGEKVLVNKPVRDEDNWRPVFIGWRELSPDKEKVVYRTFGIKVDGKPSKILSSQTSFEDELRKFKV